jgi:hypothetical protein
MARPRSARVGRPAARRGFVALVTAAVLSSAFAALAPTASAKGVKLGSTAVIRPVSGKVKYKPLGAKKYKTLAARATIKMGSSVDATHGTVKVITARDAKGSTQAGTFYDGAFTIAQARAAKAVTELNLIKGDFSKCQQASTAKAHSAAGGTAVRKLWGKAHGRFRTKGRYNAATVRGTTWLTEDFCDTSRIESKEGVVEAAPTTAVGPTYNLQPGQFFDTFCNEGQPVTGYFCLLLLSQPADNAFGFGLLLQNSPYNSYTLCITGPLRYDCGGFYVTDPDPDGFRTSAVVCKPGQGPGQYRVDWYIGGYHLGVPAYFESTQPAEELRCLSQP